ncbi:P-loop_containing nucleoside triphosphate hydrolase [Hexamita inflata]|uniref:P-loop containing nucleoside triphosphate hydrolase n=1 Tax=Hexamita inflata TaxID=28002 RepID=A0AA86R3H5_9EUKA|nr:P-loop containing nucleoside triphosphate hydrolase [Hexamita inflata]
MPVQLQNQLNIIILGDEQPTSYITKKLQQYNSYASNYDNVEQQQIKVKLNEEKYQLNFKKCNNPLQLSSYSNSNVIVLCYFTTDENYQKKIIDNWYLDIYYQMEGIPVVLVGINQNEQYMDLKAQNSLQKEIYAKYFVPFFKLTDNTHLMMENIVQCTLKKQKVGKYFVKYVKLC